jgi:hypothetical protein
MAGLLIIEDEDATNSDVDEAIFVPIDDDGTTNYYVQAGTPVFTATEVSKSFDDSDLTGYIDPFGAYALKDISGDQDIVSITLPKTQMYAELYIAEESASMSGGDTSSNLGDILVKDTEVNDVSNKNLIIVGGSCINSAAAHVLGGAYCGVSFTEKTGVGSGQFLLEGIEGAYTSGKIALLVAGYDVQDTVNAATYVRTQTFDTSKKYIGTSSTSADLITESN